MAIAADATRRGFGFLEVLVDERDRHAALSDGGGDALHRAEADVAAGEDAWDARLEQERIALELPPVGDAEIRAREHIAAGIERDLLRKPAGLGVGADEDVEPAGLVAARLARLRVADVDRLERQLAVGGHDLGPERRANIRPRRHLVDEIARHALLERLAAADDRHALRVVGEVERRLPGRVARPHDVDVQAV